MAMRLLLGILLVAGIYFAPFRDDAMMYYDERTPAESAQILDQR